MTENFKVRLKLLRESINLVSMLKANSIRVESETMKELSNQLNICKELYKKEKFKFFNSKDIIHYFLTVVKNFFNYKGILIIISRLM